MDILGIGSVTVLHEQTFDLPDTETLQNVGFSISIDAPGMESVGVDFPPGAWPDDATGKPQIIVFQPSVDMETALEKDMQFLGGLVEFLPKMDFKKKVTIKLPMNANTSEPLKGMEHIVMYYNKEDKKWEKRKHSSDPPNYVNNYCPGETKSFSEYGAILVKKGPRCGGGCIAGAVIGTLLGVVLLACGSWFAYQYYQPKDDMMSPDAEAPPARRSRESDRESEDGDPDPLPAGDTRQNARDDHDTSDV